MLQPRRQGWAGAFSILSLFGHLCDAALTSSWHRVISTGAQRSASAQSSHRHPAAIDQAVLAYSFVSIL